MHWHKGRSTVTAKICTEPGPRWRCWNCWYCAWHRPQFVPLNDRWKRFENALLFRWLPFACPIHVSCLIMYRSITYYIDCSLDQNPCSRKNTYHISIYFSYFNVSSSLLLPGCNLLMLQMGTKSHHPKLSHTSPHPNALL